MERKTSEVLFSELLKHTYIFSPSQRFIDALESVEIQDSSRFYEAVPNIQQRQESHDDGSSSYFLSLRRVLRNRNAILVEVSGLKSLWRNLASKAGMYDSSVLTRDLREDKEMIEMMASSLALGYEFSLLGKFDAFDSVTKKESSRPILVVPGMMHGESLSRILRWEEGNTIKDKDEKIFEYTI